MFSEDRKSIEFVGRRHRQKTVLCQKALSPYENFSKGSPELSDPEPFTASKKWLHRFRNWFGLKNIKSTGEVASAAEEAAATFPAELNLIRTQYYS